LEIAAYSSFRHNIGHVNWGSDLVKKMAADSSDLEPPSTHLIMFGAFTSFLMIGYLIYVTYIKAKKMDRLLESNSENEFEPMGMGEAAELTL